MPSWSGAQLSIKDRDNFTFTLPIPLTNPHSHTHCSSQCYIESWGCHVFIVWNGETRSFNCNM